MKNLRNLMNAVTLMLVLVIGAVSANAGILLSDRSVKSDPCSTDTKVDSGIIVAGATGIIVAGFTGIIVAGFTGIIVAGKGEETTNCGIIVAGRDGILLAD